MSLKGIIRRGAGYARRRDNSRYSRNIRASTPNTAGVVPGMDTTGCCFGCFAAFLFFFSFGIGLRLVDTGWEMVKNGDGIGRLVSGVIWLIFNCWLVYLILNRKPPEQEANKLEKQCDNNQLDEPKYLICSCDNCDQQLEFPSYGIGSEIQCPTCGWNMVLYDPLLPRE